MTRQKLGEVRVQQEKEVSSYREAVTVATQRYKAGQADYYELLQVQQELFPAEAALAQTRRDELISIVQLYKALGGGWNLKDPGGVAGVAITARVERVDHNALSGAGSGKAR